MKPNKQQRKQRATLERLIRTAKAVAIDRGHTLSRFKRSRGEAVATCSKCERRLVVSVRPDAKAEINGEAALYRCKFEHQGVFVPAIEGKPRPAAGDPRTDRWHRREASGLCTTVYDADGIMVGAFVDAQDAALGARAPEMRFALENAAGALDSLLWQVNQMKGSFPDGDGTIAEAVRDAEDSLEEIDIALGRKTTAERDALPAHPDFTVPVPFTRADQSQAESEGWAIFEASPDEGEARLEIEKDQDADVFEFDEDAIEHVRRKAAEGSDLHQRAIAIHEAELKRVEATKTTETAQPRAFVEVCLVVATKHGADSEPDHEVGDLQQFLRAMWGLLTPEQQAQFPKLDAVRSTIANAGADPDSPEEH